MVRLAFCLWIYFWVAMQIHANSIVRIGEAATTQDAITSRLWSIGLRYQNKHSNYITSTSRFHFMQIFSKPPDLIVLLLVLVTCIFCCCFSIIFANSLTHTTQHSTLANRFIMRLLRLVRPIRGPEIVLKNDFVIYIEREQKELMWNAEHWAHLGIVGQCIYLPRRQKCACDLPFCRHHQWSAN